MHASNPPPTADEIPGPNPEAIAWYVEEAQRLLAGLGFSLLAIATLILEFI